MTTGEDISKIREAIRYSTVYLLKQWPSLYFFLDYVTINYDPDYQDWAYSTEDQIYVGRAFFSNDLNDEVRGTILAHEALHIIFNHLNRARMAGIPPKISNIAGDALINGELERTKFRFGPLSDIIITPEGLSRKIKELTGQEISPDTIMSMTMESLAHLLMKLINEWGGGSGDLEKWSKDRKSGEGKSFVGAENEHPEHGGKNTVPVRPAVIKGKTPGEAYEEAKKKASAIGGSTIGDRYLGINAYPARINWQTLLKQVVNNAVQVSYTTYRKRDRRVPELPYTQRQMPTHIWAIIDSSASISDDEIRHALSDLKRANTDVTLVFFSDTITVIPLKNYNFKRPFEGGTLISPALDYVYDHINKMVLNVVVIFTDGDLGDDEAVLREKMRKLRNSIKQGIVVTVQDFPGTEGWVKIKYTPL